MSDLQIEYRSVESLTEYSENSRTHSDEQVAQVAASIQEFGFTNPLLVDANGVLIAGHGRLMAAKKIGLESVPVIELGHLTEAQRRAYVIADNKLAEMSGWDEDALARELAYLSGVDYQADLTGFNVDELNAIVGLIDEDVEFPVLPDGEKSEFVSITFTLHASQADVVNKAIEAAKLAGHAESAINKNTNGNALAHVCGVY